MKRESQSGSGSRGCGSRQKGGVYLCTHLSPFGSPLEDFLVDPVLPFAGEPFRAPILIADPEDIRVQHAVIWVGAQFYPSPVDFIEEVRRKGASRRVPSGFSFSALTPGKSRMIFVHPKAYTQACVLPDRCPKAIPNHGTDAPCLGAHWHLAQALGSAVHGDRGRIGDMTYPLPTQWGPDAVPDDLSPGMFLVLPINAVEYEARDRTDTVPESLQSAESVGFPVTIIDREEGE